MPSRGALIARDGLVASLRRTAEEVSARRTPQWVLLEGAMGVGKTALLNQIGGELDSWLRSGIYLQEPDQFTKGFLLTEFFRLDGGSPPAMSDETEFVEQLLQCLRQAQRPAVILIDDLHWADPFSVEILFRAIRSIQSGAVLGIATMQGRSRPDLRRMRQFLDTSLAGQVYRVKALSGKEIQQHLQGRLGIPVEYAIAEIIREATDGLPHFVSFVSDQLTRHPGSWGNRLSDALGALVSHYGPGAAHTESLRQMLTRFSPQVRDAVALAVKARQPVSVEQIREALGHGELEVEELLDTGLLEWHSESGRLSLEYPVTTTAAATSAPSVLSGDPQISDSQVSGTEVSGPHFPGAPASEGPEVTSDIRRGVWGGSASIWSHTHDHRLALGTQNPSLVAEELMHGAQQYLREADPDRALALARTACHVNPTTELAEQFAYLALSVRNTPMIRSLSVLLPHLRDGLLRQAVRVHQAMAIGDLKGARDILAATEGAEQATPKALLVFAEVTSAVAAAYSMCGIGDDLCDVLRPVIQTLDCSAQRLPHPAGDGEESTAKAESAPDDRPNQAGAAACCIDSPVALARDGLFLRSLLQMWDLLSRVESRDFGQTQQDLDDLIHGLLGIPGSDYPRAIMLNMKSVALCRAGDLASGYRLAEEVLRLPLPAGAGVFTASRVWMAYALFHAGRWDEARDMALTAASNSLTLGHELDLQLRHAVNLVPAARGEVVEDSAWCAVPAEPAEPAESAEGARCPESFRLSEVSRAYAQAWSAIAEDDHDQTAALLLRVRGGGDRWTGGIWSTILLGRAYLYSGRGYLIGPLLEEVAQDSKSPEWVTQCVTEALRGLWSRASGELHRSFASLRRAWTMLVPTSTPDVGADSAGEAEGAAAADNAPDEQDRNWPHRIYAALIGVEMARLVLSGDFSGDPQDRAIAEYAAGWAASLFHLCGAQLLFRQADELAQRLARPTAAHRRRPQSAAPGTPGTSGGSGALGALGAARAGPPEPGGHLVGVSSELAASDDESLTVLTPRERQIALLLHRGDSNREIAAELTVSVRTVEFHVANILSKLHLSSRHDLRGRFRQG